MMRNCLIVIIIFLFCPSRSSWADEKTIQLPPNSIAQWYKPVNKRQVWLHNMFKLRREMQAVQEYADLKDRKHLEKWAARLVSHYHKISEMVPEWEDELLPDWAARLEEAAQKGDFEAVKQAARKLGQSCRSCHREYRAVVAALYRVPDYTTVKVKDERTGKTQDYPETMKELSALVNRIKIAAEDDRKQVALDAFGNLKSGLDDLGESCNSCHKGPQAREIVLGVETEKVLTALVESIETDEKKMIGRNLGTAAVVICARCHGIHRTVYDLKRAIVPVGWVGEE